MTKIQLRRDTAANWSTNNPTPSAGEPCFETDTGKLKIGDGSTKYNDLAYQGGGSAPANMMTTDTDQNIIGIKNFSVDWNKSSENGVFKGLKAGFLALGNDTGTSSNYGVIGVDSGMGFKLKLDGSEAITVNHGNYYGESTVVISGYDESNPATISGIGALSLKAAGGNDKGLQITQDGVSFTNSAGVTTNLLSGGGASIDDTKTATDKVWSSDKVNTELGKKQDTLPTTDAGYNIDINGSSVAGQTVYFGGNTSASLAPHVKANTSSHILNINGYGIDGSGITMYDTVLKTKSFKYGDRTNQYEVVNKSPANNEYMAHMAMPSDKYINLTLGASGTTYTAPADGYFILTGSLPSSSDVGHCTLINRLNTTSGTDGKLTVRCYGVGSPNVGTGLYASVPAKAGDNVVASWAGAATASILRFIYAVGSKPTA